MANLPKHINIPRNNSKTNQNSWDELQKTPIKPQIATTKPNLLAKQSKTSETMKIPRKSISLMELWFVIGHRFSRAFDWS